MNKLIKYIGFSVMALFGYVGFAGATPPENLSDVSTAWLAVLTTQLGSILTFVLGVAGVVIVVVLSIRGIKIGLGWLRRVFRA